MYVVSGFSRTNVARRLQASTKSAVLPANFNPNRELLSSCVKVLVTRLRRQRERQQVSLSTIAERTKIHQPLLEDLERDEASRWPSGIFRRAFIRSYAGAIGLKPDDVVREFLEFVSRSARGLGAASAPAVVSRLAANTHDEARRGR